MSTTPDTRKIPDDILQAAIDAALIASQLTGFDSSEFQPGWTSQSTHRLALARGLLARLPEPTPPVSADGKTPGQVAFEAWGNEPYEWHKSLTSNWQAAASAVLAAFGQPSLEAAIARAEKAEAELATLQGRHDRLIQERDKLKFDCDRMSEQEVLSLSQLRPIAEAGPVPEGCVRYHFKKHDNGVWSVGTLTETRGDSHFADIRLPTASHDSPPAYFGYMTDEAPTPASQPAKPEPATFEAHGKIWTRHTPGDPMPCDGERMVDIITQKALNEGNWFSFPHKGEYWQWNTLSKIIGWRYAEEPPAQPWQPAVGDLVQLKSGGPVMTIKGGNQENTFCVWFDGVHTCSDHFPAACLTPAQEAQP